MLDKNEYPLLRTLPDHLSERIRPLNDHPVAVDGEFVLYWMHHAVRSHENPALDAALLTANRLQLPVLVYQGLGGRHPYNNDRHHTFILQGAREVEAGLSSLGISYAFYLATSPHKKTPLLGLLSRSALTVTEEFPVPPLKQWTRRIAALAPSPLWAVDTACILPMQAARKSYDRAFRFRRDTWNELARRMRRPYPTLTGTIRAYEGDLGFQPIRLAFADIAECCASCQIDHTVGPVAHTRGGAKAGYDRWNQFKEHGLRDYEKNRNDAAIEFPSGVSRMSAYLHHGHVSPFRIVREAALSNCKGAHKYLDEILIWRELAHNFCFFHHHPGHFNRLPSWARETLEFHRQDPRKPIFTWEVLARGRTGDPLWDAAQRSLLNHGELHNNLRMTWGKALLQWTRTPQEALRMMLDLNHRFALDGSDPNSYAGILWCLGLFDRPFKPPRPVIGTLRPRSTRSHAARVNLDRYTKRVVRPATGPPLRVAVIGAGVSGLVAARTLADHGHHVRVFEKSRGLGGRSSTRRAQSFAFDHGAQYFTTRDPRFKQWIDSWRQIGLVRRWHGRIGVLRSGSFSPEKGNHDRFVCVPGMSALAGHLAKDLNILCSTRIEQIRTYAREITLTDSKKGCHAKFDALITTAPPEQSFHLLRRVTPLAGRLPAVQMNPCWAVMLAFDNPLPLEFDGAFVQDATLSWVARNASKPGRDSTECWVLHATADWSTVHLDLAPDAVISQLSASFSQAAGVSLPEPVFSGAHRWRFAQAQQPLLTGCLWDRQSRIGICGDWCFGSRIEGAFLSGSAAAGRLLSSQPGYTDRSYLSRANDTCD